MELIRAVRRLVVGGLVGLTLLCALGAGALAVAEGVGYLDGMWLAFSVVSTTGFGAGPTTSSGMVLSMVLFILALPCYLTLVAAAVAVARSLAPSVRGPRPMLVERDVRRVVEDLNRN